MTLGRTCYSLSRLHSFVVRTSPGPFNLLNPLLLRKKSWLLQCSLHRSGQMETDEQRRFIISASLSITISIPSGSLVVRNICLDHLCVSVCVCVRKVYCGKTADWIRMPFGVVSVVGLGMGVLEFVGDCRRGRSSFGGEFGASHCNQWGLCDALFSN